jgi:DNA-binding transcriptional LysR family regulator
VTAAGASCTRNDGGHAETSRFSPQGLTQSSVSHALAGLRDVFDDPLFVRRPFGMEPTPRALELEPIVEAILDLSPQALAPTEFDLADARVLFASPR